jgi:hypothetical protein
MGAKRRPVKVRVTPWADWCGFCVVRFVFEGMELRSSMFADRKTAREYAAKLQAIFDKEQAR